MTTRFIAWNTVSVVITDILAWGLVDSQRPPLTNFNSRGGGRGGGVGSDRGSYFCTQKNPNFRICLPKKITTFFSIPKKSLKSFFHNPKKIPLFFFVAQKNPAVFHRPKKITFCQNFRPKKITRPSPVINICEWGPWGLTSSYLFI